jgi:hypothetical protein
MLTQILDSRLKQIRWEKLPGESVKKYDTVFEVPQ